MPKPVKRKKTVEVDFAGVESGGGRKIPDGEYTLEVQKVTEEESSEGNPYLKWVYAVAEGDLKGAKVFDNTSLQPQSLWRLKTLLECLGMEVPDSTLQLDLAELEGLTVGVEIVNEEYQGRDRPRVANFLGGETEEKSSKKKDDDDEDEEDEKPSKSKKKTKGPSIKEGTKVSFEDDDGKTQKGTVTSVDGDTITVDVKGDEWELDRSELTAL